MTRVRVLVAALACLAATAVAAGPQESSRELALRLLATGRAQIARGDHDPAILTLTQAREADPDESEIYNALADAYLGLGLEPMGAMQLEKSLAADSTQIAPRLRLAELHEHNRRYVEAGRAYRDVLRREPANDVAALALAALYGRAKQPTNAAWVLEGYVIRHPEDQERLALYLHALLAAAQYDGAAVAAERALDACPDWPPALRAAGLARAALEQPEPAVVHLARLEKAQPLDAECCLALARCFLKLKNDVEAVARYDQVLVAQPDASGAWSEIAGAYMRIGRYGKAAELYERRIAQDSTAVSAYVNLGLCRHQTKEYDAARHALRRAVELKPDHVKARAALAGTYVLMDSTRAARRAYLALIEQALAAPDAWRAELYDAYRYLSVGHLLDKNWGSALDTLTKAVAFKPQDIEMHLYRAQALFALNRKVEAKKEFETVLQMEPANKNARKGLDLLAQYN